MTAKLYTSDDLLDGYVEGDPRSYLATWDFRQFMRFVQAGGPNPRDPVEGLRQADHDAGIGTALRDYLAGEAQRAGAPPRIVGIMGGHGLRRTDPAYAVVADLARGLARAGFLVATGGGPGAMEAGHFGAYFANSSDGAYAAALAVLRTQPRLVDLTHVLGADGTVDPAQDGAVRGAFDWLTAAIDARKLVDGAVGPSLAVPTWLYGSEPTTPFATAYAKYFQNSIREETLVAEGTTGVIYAQGGGGTLREIFQGVERNYYVASADAFTPMIFADPGRFWETDATFAADGSVRTPGIDLKAKLRAIFTYAIPAGYRDDCLRKICFSVDAAEIHAVLGDHAPNAQRKLELMLTGVPANLVASRFMRSG